MRGIIGPVAIVVVAAVAACSTHYVPRGPGVYTTLEGGKVVYVRGGQKFEHGFLGGGLVDAVAPNPAARQAAEKARSQMKKGLLVMLGGLVIGTAALAFSFDEDENGDIGVNETMLGASLLAYIAAYGGIFFFVDAQTYQMDAINIFNDGANGGGRPDWNAPPGQRRGYSLQMRK